MSNITTSVNGNHQTVISNIVYLPFGPINGFTYGNGMTNSRTYDTDYRLTGRIDSGVLNDACTRDASGNITEHTNVTEIGFCDEQFCGSAVTLDINRYQYDTVHRLTQSDMNSDIEAFSYDALGNTLSTHSHTFSYDDNNRIITVDDAASTLLATYTYNAQNLRTKKVAATTTYYHYNHEGQLISESDNSGNITREYMYLNGSPIAMSDVNGRYYLHSDHLGTPKVMTDSQQDIVWQATHTAFGEATTDEDPDGDGINVRLNIRFTGQYYDEETNLHYNWHRYYDPSIGRYISSDPIGLAGGINTYGYVNQNPINRIDPYGLFDLFDWFGSVEGHAIAGGGAAYVECCNEDGDKLKMKFIKFCEGLTLGISAIAGKVEGISGRKCDSESYSGYFLEFSVGIGPFSGGGDIGLTSTGSGFPFGVGRPNGLSGVTEYGAGLGAGAPAGISLCYYVPKEVVKEPCGCNK